MKHVTKYSSTKVGTHKITLSIIPIKFLAEEKMSKNMLHFIRNYIFSIFSGKISPS